MDILALSNLLNDQSCEYLDRDESHTQQLSSTRQSITTPASFGRPKSLEDINDKQTRKCIDDGDIWSSDEIPSCTNSCEPHDERDEPLYQIYFKQEIGTENVFMGTDKSPGSFDCTDIVVKIHFPNSKLDELNVDINSNCLLAESRDKYVQSILATHFYYCFGTINNHSS